MRTLFASLMVTGLVAMPAMSQTKTETFEGSAAANGWKTIDAPGTDGTSASAGIAGDLNLNETTIDLLGNGTGQGFVQAAPDVDGMALIYDDTIGTFNLATDDMSFVVDYVAQIAPGQSQLAGSMFVGFVNLASTQDGANQLLDNSIYWGAGYTDPSYQTLGALGAGNFSTFKVTNLGFGAGTTATIYGNWDARTSSFTIGWDFNGDTVIDAQFTETYTADQVAGLTVDAFAFGMNSWRNGGPVLNIHEYRGAIDNATYSVIPEPVSAALMGLGSLLILGRNRKARA